MAEMDKETDHDTQRVRVVREADGHDPGHRRHDTRNMSEVLRSADTAAQEAALVLVFSQLCFGRNSHPHSNSPP